VPADLLGLACLLSLLFDYELHAFLGAASFLRETFLLRLGLLFGLTGSTIHFLFYSAYQVDIFLYAIG
jgi:hypothetical protein